MRRKLGRYVACLLVAGTAPLAFSAIGWMVTGSRIEPALVSFGNNLPRRLVLECSFGVGAALPLLLALLLLAWPRAAQRCVAVTGAYVLVLCLVRAWVRSTSFVALHAAGRMGTGGYSSFSSFLVDMALRDVSAALLPVGVCLFAVMRIRFPSDYDDVPRIAVVAGLTRVALLCASGWYVLTDGVVPMVCYLPLSMSWATRGGLRFNALLELVVAAARIALPLSLLTSGLMMRANWKRIRAGLLLVLLGALLHATPIVVRAAIPDPGPLGLPPTLVWLDVARKAQVLPVVMVLLWFWWPLLTGRPYEVVARSQCASCGYHLLGAASARCPECGERIPPGWHAPRAAPASHTPGETPKADSGNGEVADRGPADDADGRRPEGGVRV